MKWARTELFQKLLVKESNGHMNLKSVILAWDNNIRPNEFTTKQKLDGVGPEHKLETQPQYLYIIQCSQPPGQLGQV